jgi:hypothetical protein
MSVSAYSTVSHPTPSPRAVSFAGVPTPKRFRLERLGNSLDAFVPFTQAITEDFFWQFIMLDVFALWMTRIYNSLTRGRKPYQLPADKDSKNANRPHTVQEKAQIAAGTVKGLNWTYFAEEAGREFLVGPGFFSLFGMVYGLYRLNINQGIHLPIQALNRFSDTLGQHLRNTVKSSSPLTQAQLVQHAADSLTGQWQSAHGFIQQHGPHLKDWQHKWVQHMNAVIHYERSTPPQQRWKNGISHWWQTRPFKAKHSVTLPPNFQAVKKAEAALDQAAKALQDLALNFQLNQPNLDYTRLHDMPLTVMQRKGKHLVKQTRPHTVQTWLAQAKQFQHVVLSLSKQPLNNPASDMARLLNRLTGQKLAAALTATGVVGAYLVLLTKLFQSSKQYPGNNSRRASDMLPGMPGGMRQK